MTPECQRAQAWRFPALLRGDDWAPLTRRGSQMEIRQALARLLETGQAVGEAAGPRSRGDSVGQEPAASHLGRWWRR